MIAQLFKNFICRSIQIKPVNLSYAHRFIFKNSLSFCTTKLPPAIQKLIQVKNVQELSPSLIQIYKLNDTNKRLGLRIVMQRIKDGYFPQYVLVDQKFIANIKKFPDLQIEAFLIRIQDQLKHLQKIIKSDNEVNKKLAVKDINTCFTIVFETLKKLPKKDIIPFQIRVYKMFARYHQNYLMRLIEHKRYKQILGKSLEFYKAALNKITLYLQKQQSKVKDSKAPTQLDIQNIDLDNLTEEKGNQIENNIEYKYFTYSQEYCEILYQAMMVQNYISDPRIKQTPRPRSNLQIPFRYNPALFDMIPLFDQALVLLKKFDQKSSKFYYKIRKTHMELIYRKEMHENKEDKVRQKKIVIQFIRKMELYCNQIIQDLKNLPADESSVELCEEMTLVLLGVKTYIISFFNKNMDSFQRILVKEIKLILDIFQQKTIKDFILSSFTVALSSTLKINLQKHFGKIPRPVAYRQRKPKIEQHQQQEQQQEQDDAQEQLQGQQSEQQDVKIKQ